MADQTNAVFILGLICAIAAWELFTYARGGWDAMLSGTVRRIQRRWWWFAWAVAVVFAGLWWHWFGW